MIRPLVLALHRKGQALCLWTMSQAFQYSINNRHVCVLPSFILIHTIIDTLYSKTPKGHQYINMPELPPEIWSMIVKHVKRDLPPAGAPGNWNDHFHQQDLTSLMRVNHVSLFRFSIVCTHLRLILAAFVSCSRLFAMPTERRARGAIDRADDELVKRVLLTFRLYIKSSQKYCTIPQSFKI